jgi:uncharacterized protein (TIGR02117 family)
VNNFLRDAAETNPATAATARSGPRRRIIGLERSFTAGKRSSIAPLVGLDIQQEPAGLYHASESSRIGGLARPASKTSRMRNRRGHTWGRPPGRRGGMEIRLVRVAFLLAGFVIGMLAGCRSAGDDRAQPTQGPVSAAAPGSAIVYVIARDWHTDIGLPMREAAGTFASVIGRFPGAQYFIFGFGDREFYQKRETGFFDMVKALFPGPGVLLVTALRSSPEEAFAPKNVVALTLSQEGLDRLVAFIRGSFVTDRAGAVLPLSEGPYPGSLFYASTRTYDAFYTCNTWTAEALQFGGLAVTVSGVLFAGQVVEQARAIEARQAGRGTAVPRNPPRERTAPPGFSGEKPYGHGGFVPSSHTAADP